MFFENCKKMVKTNGSDNFPTWKFEKNRMFELRIGTLTIGFAQHVFVTSNPDPCWMCRPSEKMHITATPSNIHEHTSTWATNPKMCVFRPPGTSQHILHYCDGKPPFNNQIKLASCRAWFSNNRRSAAKWPILQMSYYGCQSAISGFGMWAPL